MMYTRPSDSSTTGDHRAAAQAPLPSSCVARSRVRVEVKEAGSCARRSAPVSRKRAVDGMTMKISFAEFEPPRRRRRRRRVEDRELTAPAASARSRDRRRRHPRARRRSRFRGKKNELLIPLVGPPNLSADRIVVAGLGKPEAIERCSCRISAAHSSPICAGAERDRSDFADRCSATPRAAAGRPRRHWSRLWRGAARLPLRQIPHDAEAGAEADGDG